MLSSNINHIILGNYMQFYMSDDIELLAALEQIEFERIYKIIEFEILRWKKYSEKQKIQEIRQAFVSLQQMKKSKTEAQ